MVFYTNIKIFELVECNSQNALEVNLSIRNRDIAFHFYENHFECHFCFLKLVTSNVNLVHLDFLCFIPWAGRIWIKENLMLQAQQHVLFRTLNTAISIQRFPNWQFHFIPLSPPHNSPSCIRAHRRNCLNVTNFTAVGCVLSGQFPRKIVTIQNIKSEICFLFHCCSQFSSFSPYRVVCLFSHKLRVNKKYTIISIQFKTAECSCFPFQVR